LKTSIQYILSRRQNALIDRSTIFSPLSTLFQYKYGVRHQNF